MTNDQDTGIRRYGPGKFNTILDRYVWGVSLTGCDEDLFSSDRTWHGIIRDGLTIFKDHDSKLNGLNEVEREKLINATGVIMTGNTDGTVFIEYFEISAALETAWDEINKKAEEEEGI